MKNEKGAAILEFALVGGLFLMLVLAIIDLSRYYALQALLTKGAQNGLALAKTIPNLDIDVQELASVCDHFDPNTEQTLYQECLNENYQDFLDARAEVIIEAARLPLATLADEPNSDTGSELIAYSMDDTTFMTTVPTGQTNFSNLSAAVIRPGDQAYLGALEDNYVIEHPSICAKSGSCIKGQRKRKDGEQYETLLRNHPLVVTLRADVNMILPMFGSTTIEGTAMGYREVNSKTQTGELPDELRCLDTAEKCNNGPNNNFTLDPDTCDCQCSITDADCPGLTKLDFDYLPAEEAQCECVCNDASETQARCFDDAVFDRDSCSCECPNTTCEGEGMAPNPANGCTCECDPSLVADDFCGNRKEPTTVNGQCGCKCKDWEPEYDENGNQTNGGGEWENCLWPLGVVRDSETCGCRCRDEYLEAGLNNSFGGEEPTNGASCDSVMSEGVSAFPPGMVFNSNPVACVCVCPEPAEGCPAGQLWDGGRCLCRCPYNVEDGPNPSRCAEEGLGFDSASCTCGGCINEVNESQCGPGETFANCACSCNETPCSGASERPNGICNEACVCPASASASCPDDLAHEWDNSSCVCKNLTDGGSA